MGKITIEFNNEEYCELKNDLQLGLKAHEAFSKLHDIATEIRNFTKHEQKFFMYKEFKDEYELLQIISDFIYEDGTMDAYI